MRGVLSLLFVIVLVSAHQKNGNLDESEIKYIKEKKVLKVCINPDWNPIEFRENGVPKGISIDILKHITQKIGLKLKFIKTNSWKISQLYLKKGLCDITPTAIKTLKREKYAIFTRTYLNYDLAIITKQDKPYVTNLTAILDKTITRKKGSGIITKLKKIYPNIHIFKAISYKQMLELVNNGKIYATISTLPVFAYYKKKYNLDNLKIAGFTGWNYPLRIMINKEEDTLKSILDMELKLITPKITQKIYEKWTLKVKPEINYKQLFLVLSIFVFILFVVSIWIYILHQKNKKLKQLSEVKSKFLSNMSHELRTPLNVIIGFIQIIKTNPQNTEKYISLIDISSQNLLIIIDGILNFSNFENNKITINKEEFSPKVLKEILLLSKTEAEKKGLKCQLISKNLPVKLIGDINKIKAILVYLVDNAVKFTEKGEIIVSLIYKNEYFFVSVKDTGIGISQNKFDDIFKPFVQLDDRINKNYQGIGIGLFIAQKFVKVLGGELKIHSVLNKGSEFYFEIPIKKQSEFIQNNNCDLGKILIVEDNKANQMFLKVILKQMNLDFDIAENGLIAYKMYKNFHYSLILMDINMPVMDGITATNKIREYEIENKLVPSKIIAVTANAIDGDKENILSKGMNDYISKPVDIEKLRKILN